MYSIVQLKKKSQPSLRLLPHPAVCMQKVVMCCSRHCHCCHRLFCFRILFLSFRAMLAICGNGVAWMLVTRICIMKDDKENSNTSISAEKATQCMTDELFEYNHH